MNINLILFFLVVAILPATLNVYGVLLATPQYLFNVNQVIIDGTIVSSKQLSLTQIEYEIKVNNYFKNSQENESITAVGPTFESGELYGKIYEVDDSALFYLNLIENQYRISPYSLQATSECSPRQMLGLYLLPDELHLEQQKVDPQLFKKCIPYLSSLSDTVRPPLKQTESGLVIDDISCFHDLQLIIKQSTNTPSCVKPSSMNELLSRGWGILPI